MDTTCGLRELKLGFRDSRGDAARETGHDLGTARGLGSGTMTCFLDFGCECARAVFWAKNLLSGAEARVGAEETFRGRPRASAGETGREEDTSRRAESGALFRLLGLVAVTQRSVFILSPTACSPSKTSTVWRELEINTLVLRRVERLFAWAEGARSASGACSVRLCARALSGSAGGAAFTSASSSFLSLSCSEKCAFSSAAAAASIWMVLRFIVATPLPLRLALLTGSSGASAAG